MGSDPSARIIYSCDDPERSLSKTICRPSGDQLGAVSMAGPSVIGLAKVGLATSMIQISVLPPLSRENAIHFPSGEKRGAKLMARGSWVRAVEVTVSTSSDMICGTPLAKLVYSTVCPSGEKRGDNTRSSFEVSHLMPAPS